MRVVVAEDNVLLRDGIVLVLGDHEIDVVAAVGNATELLAVVQRDRPDLAIVDVRMPPTHTDEGIRAAIEIRTRHRGTGVLVFSQWVETHYARELLADNPDRVGYLLKDRIVATADFIDAVRRVAAGGTALDPEVVRQLLARTNVDPAVAKLS